MSVSEGDVLTVRHYSEIKMFKTAAIKVEGNSISIFLTNDFAKINLLEGDPLVCGIQKENIVYTYGCTAVKIRTKEKIAELVVDSINTSENKRQHERIPVSLNADIKFKDNIKSQIATIKDLSYYGISMLTKIELNDNEIIEMDINIDRSILNIKGNIVRRINHENWLEYGISMVYDDIETLNGMKEYVKELKRKQEDSIRELIEIK